MKKEKLRFLALGFFLSAIFLMAFQLLQSSGFNITNLSITENETTTELSIESTSESVASSSASSLSRPEESSKEESVSSDTDSKTDKPILFTIKEGEPSLVIIENLHKADLIDDIDAAQAYLEKENLASRIPFGTYELTKDMTYQEIFTTFITQE
ncbi:hypothetical protein BW727_100600 [Jeotgalibaca dankookensis]|uniref:YceG-like family protein n=1 Tax=Jeotgalibaca dankookensis TaxID=708126 RepID=A0A1S6IN70_9LACT|nr:hypothetical protein [Jeotgalibaca dankookensis]AQS52993.1 hypothetical protein BW727_100600 [Jeotgalibaca dankookensis]